MESHDEGASATHSADDTSGADIRSVFVSFVLRVRLLICSVTFVPLTLTDAAIALSWKTFSSIGTLAAGTSSYHIASRPLRLALRSASVPICSSAGIRIGMPRTFACPPRKQLRTR